MESNKERIKRILRDSEVCGNSDNSIPHPSKNNMVVCSKDKSYPQFEWKLDSIPSTGGCWKKKRRKR